MHGDDGSSGSDRGGGTAGDPGAAAGTLPVPSTSGDRHGRWTRVGGTIVQAAATSIAVAILLTVITIQRDDARSEREQRAAVEQNWRDQLRSGSSFPRADLVGVDLSDLYAPEVNLAGADLRGTDLTDADLTGARLDATDAAKASFAGARLDDASLIGASLHDADLRRAHLDAADLRGADLNGANLSNAGLRATDVRGTDLRTAELSGADLRYLCWDERTRWPEGVTPTSGLCPERAAEPTELEGVRYSLELVAADDLVGDGGQRYEHVLTFDDGDAHLLLQVIVAGVVPLRDVTLLLQLPEGVDASAPPTLYNGNDQDGYRFPDEAIQAGGRQVNLGIGNYDPGTNAFIELPVTVTACEPISVDAYLTPESFATKTEAVELEPTC